MQKIRLKLLYVLVFLILLVNCSKKTFTSAVHAYENIPITESGVDSTSEKIIYQYRIKLEEEMNRVIGYAAENLYKDKPYNLIYFITDAVLIETEKQMGIEIDMSLMNYGGVRIPVVNKGPIKISTIYELLPFDNESVVITLDGKTTFELLKSMAETERMFISNVVIKIKRQKAVEMTIKGKPFDINRDYTILASDYLADGGDYLTILTKAKSIKNTDVRIRDQVISYIEKEHLKGNLLKPVTDSKVIRMN